MTHYKSAVIRVENRKIQDPWLLLLCKKFPRHSTMVPVKLFFKCQDLLKIHEKLDNLKCLWILVD